MLGNSPIVPTIPVTDLAVSRKFYVHVLGLSVIRESPMGIFLRAGDNTSIYLFKRGEVHTEHTLAVFIVNDIEETIAELTQKGVTFDQVDTPDIKTNEKGIAVIEAEEEIVAWFRDPDGNFLAISQILKQRF